MQRSTLLMHRSTALAALSGIVLATAGCGGGDGTAADAVAASTPSDPTTYCTAVFDLTAASNEDLGMSPETASRREIRTASIAWFGSDKAARLMDEAVTTAPTHLATDTRVLVDGLREYAASGDDRTVARTIGGSQARIDRYLEQKCPDVVEQ